MEQVCSADASTVSSRVESHYRAQGYVSTTYEGMGEETFSIYFSLCMASVDGYVDIYGFCNGVEAWRYFFDQEAGAQEWLDDCFARKFF